MTQPLPTLEHYNLGRVVGRGGAATVYEAHDIRHNRPVALKVINVGTFDDANRRAFTRELQAMGRLSDHPHVVQVYDSGFTDASQPFLVMPLMADGSYSEHIHQRGALAVGELLDLGVKIGSALATAHTRGILHCDIKPNNLLLGVWGEPMLADFGISSVSSSGVTTTTSSSHTIMFAAPEILENQRPSVASDVYSLGATLFALASGAAPFQGDTPGAIIANILGTASRPRLDSEAIEVVDLIAEMMDRDPAMRPASAAEVVERLRAIQRTYGVAATDAFIGAPTDVPATAPTGPATPIGQPTGAAVSQESGSHQSGPQQSVSQQSVSQQPGSQQSQLLQEGTTVSADAPSGFEKLANSGQKPGRKLLIGGGVVLLTVLGLFAGRALLGSETTGGTRSVAAEATAIVAEPDTPQNPAPAERPTAEPTVAAASPASEPTAEAAPEPTAEAAPEPTAEAAPEPTAEAAPESTAVETEAAPIPAPTAILSGPAPAPAPPSTELVTPADSASFGLLGDAPPGDRGPQGQAHTGIVNTIDWSVSGLLATAGADSVVRIWSTEGELLAELPQDSAVVSVSWSPDGARLAVADDSAIVIWDMVSGDALVVPNSARQANLVWSGDGTRVASSTWQRVHLWESMTGASLFIGGTDLGSVRAIDMDDEGRIVALMEEGHIIEWSTTVGGDATIWVVLATTYGGTVRYLDSDTLLVGYADDAIQFFERGNPTPVRSLEDISHAIRVHFSPDGTWFVSIGQDSVARIWDYESGRRVALLNSGAPPATEATWSPDGSRVAVSGLEGRVAIFDITDLSAIQQLDLVAVS